MVASLAATGGTQDAVANGDTRTLSLIQDHTKETLTVTFKRNGSYDSEGLKQLNWLLRDWRQDEQTRMDPRLFDVVWEVYREVGAEEPIHVVSGYRSPETNAMLRRRSRVVAEQSQHMRGKAMDFYLPGVAMSRVREIGMRLQDGGVGFYPNAFNPFVHLDVGSVRAWPRMTHDQLARLFPDGRTVHIPRDGKPLPGYEEAKAQVLAKGGSVAGVTTYAEAEEEGGGSRKSLWAMLFGGGEDEDTTFYRQQRQPAKPAGRAAGNAYASAGNSSDGGARGFFSFGQPDPEPQPEPAPRAPEPGRPAAPLFDPVPSAESGATRERADGVPAIQMLAATPMPPKRPADLEPLLQPVLVAMPMPPARPMALASVQQAAPDPGALRGQMRATPQPRPGPPGASPNPVPSDDRAALRSLFAAAVTPAGERGAAVTTSRARPAGDPGGNARAVFSVAETGLRADRFSGSALPPAPILR
jgi:uncharacterized protein YcbK (DUF882 family)